MEQSKLSVSYETTHYQKTHQVHRTSHGDQCHRERCSNSHQVQPEGRQESAVRKTGRH